ncbi:MAG: DUF1214 domain-containing protein [Pseudomonadales bacterium]|jgi:hypothetical protein|nr:DUF1214 domain-containing protein [Pseudomonadales bacterium]MCP5336170.1 DUF1214 domain-containing protein [Pseudomonadales bacterium]
MSESRQAFRELLALLAEIDAGYVGEPDATKSALDVADGHRLLLHGLQRAIGSQLEADPYRPVFRRAITPVMKFGGDSPDAIYHECNIASDGAYRIRGNVAGAVYVSFAIQSADAGGEGVGGTLNSEEFDVGPDGSFELLLMPDATPGERNCLRIPAGALGILARHYYESVNCVMGEAQRHVPLQIDYLGEPRAGAEPDAAVTSAGIRRVSRLLRSRTLDEMRGRGPVPAWVSRVPNQFTAAQKPDAGMAYAALDIAYAMAPFHVPAGKALVMSGRFPVCRYAGVVLWTRFRQSFDYLRRRVSLNRAQTALESDGSYRIVIAAEDPGVPNWLDTGGRSSGLVYWRFLLPHEAIQTPHTELADLAALRG